MTAQLIFSLSFLVLVCIIAFYFIWSMFFGVPFYPSNKEAINAILNFLQKDKNAKIVELGAGDGRISFTIAKLGYKVTAIEFNPFLSMLMRIKKFLFRVKNVEIKNINFFNEDLNKYDTYICYLFPASMEKLDKILFAKENSGKYVISNTFAFKGRTPDKKNGKVYRYIIN